MNLNSIGKTPKKLSVDLIHQPLGQEFFVRPTLEVCADLLGKLLCRRLPNNHVMVHHITEVEAYFGFEDKASHGFKRTPRSQILYGPAGIWYVYLCYGIHEMLNIVTEKEEFPGAILIRGVSGISGPGRVTKAFQINRQLNGLASDPDTHLWISDSNLVFSRKDYSRTARIGVDYAGPIWSKKQFRFLLHTERLQKQLSQAKI